MKKIYKLLSMALGLTLLFSCFAGCINNPANVSAAELSYVSMRINPEIELVVDKDGIVVGVNAINEDGETVLSELDLVGMTVEEAGQSFTEMATTLGFIDVDNENVVYILAKGKNKRFNEKIEDKITEKINDFFDRKGIFGKVSLEEIEKFETLATEWNVSVEEAIVINRVLELYPEMTVEEVTALSFREKLDLIKDNSSKNDITVDLRKEYKEKVEELKEKYANMFALRKELEELELKLADTTLSEDDLLALQAEYDAKKAEYLELKEAYHNEIKELKETYREKVKDAKEQIKEKAHARRNHFSEKLEKHDHEFEKQKEERQREIKEWRKSHR
ncbi:MAG: hypothetical protein IKC71_05000 [Clostridia bacterium]|nr:hypothetical protein [Clostridia bacterium]